MPIQRNEFWMTVAHGFDELRDGCTLGNVQARSGTDIAQVAEECRVDMVHMACRPTGAMQMVSIVQCLVQGFTRRHRCPGRGNLGWAQSKFPGSIRSIRRQPCLHSGTVGDGAKRIGPLALEVPEELRDEVAVVIVAEAKRFLQA